jgi:hypothetical protein
MNTAALYAIAAVIGVVLVLFFVALARVLLEPGLSTVGLLAAFLVTWTLTAARPGGRSSSARPVR